ncbi:MAG: putative CXXCH cytochrome family protein [Gammaproteobacteria bacterium]|jgi:predicted CXXCH cytochrome family protein
MRLILVVWMMSPATVASNPDSTFVGSDQCIQCHQTEHSKWQLSDHHRAMQRPDEKTVLGNFNDITVEFHGIKTRFYRHDNNFMVATVGAGGKPGVFAIDYTFGHYPLQQYLVDIGNGHLQALNVAWDSRPAAAGGQRWYHLQAEETINPEHPFFWTRHFQNANSRCIECHSTNVSKNFSSEAKTYDTTWSEIGVGCESCHGPAANHVSLAKADGLNENNSGFSKQSKPQLSWAFRGNDDTASPSGTINSDYLNSCGGCHSRRASFGDVEPLTAYHDQYRLALLDQGLYFADGQINDEVFVLGSFLQSKMQQQGVTCANCHEPHSGKLVAEGNSLCAQCHNSDRFDSSEHHQHEAETTGAQCVNCHMPESLYMGVDLRRDHSFSIPDPALSQVTDAPNACINCHQDKEHQWAAEAMSGWGVAATRNVWATINQGLEQQDSLMFRNYAQDPPTQVKAPIRQATLISKLRAFPSQLAIETAAPNLTNPDPLLRRAAVTAIRPMPIQLRWQLLSPLITDPLKVVRLEVANALVDVLPLLEGKDADRLGKLVEEYRVSLAYFADTPGGQLSIGNLELGLGYNVHAEKAYKRALEIEPHFVPALINLSDLYRANGTDGESIDLLQHALEVAPDSATSNHAYGLFLVRSGKQTEALGYFKAAIDQEDSIPRHVYVYAVALDSLGQTEAAMQVIAQQSKRWPNNIDLVFLQISYMEKTGMTKGIHKYLSILATVAANNPQVKDWMQKYGG